MLGGGAESARGFKPEGKASSMLPASVSPHRCMEECGTPPWLGQEGGSTAGGSAGAGGIDRSAPSGVGKVENRNRAGAGVGPSTPSAAAGMENSWGGGGRLGGVGFTSHSHSGGTCGVLSQLCCWWGLGTPGRLVQGPSICPAFLSPRRPVPQFPQALGVRWGGGSDGGGKVPGGPGMEHPSDGAVLRAAQGMLRHCVPTRDPCPLSAPA